KKFLSRTPWPFSSWMKETADVPAGGSVNSQTALPSAIPATARPVAFDASEGKPSSLWKRRQRTVPLALRRPAISTRMALPSDAGAMASSRAAKRNLIPILPSSSGLQITGHDDTDGEEGECPAHRLAGPEPVEHVPLRSDHQVPASAAQVLEDPIQR